MKQTIYMDNAATTPVKKEVLNEMIPMFKDNFGNPSTIYKTGKTAREKVEIAREQVAKALGANTCSCRIICVSSSYTLSTYVCVQ